MNNIWHGVPGTGCPNEGNCETCPCADCVATPIECTKFYRDEERITRSKYGRKRKRHNPGRGYELDTRFDGKIERIDEAITCTKL